VRHEYAYVSQEELFGEIELTYRHGSKPLDFADIEPETTIHATASCHHHKA